MPDGQEPLRFGDEIGTADIDIFIGAVADVVTVPFEPVDKRIFPQQEFAGTQRERMIHHLGVLGVRPIKTGAHTGDERFLVRAVVVVQRVVLGPLVVGLPGIRAALEENISRAIVCNNKNDVALVAVVSGRKLAQIDTRWPVGRNTEFRKGIPSTRAQALVGNRWCGLRPARKRPKLGHAAGTQTLIIAHAEDIDRDRTGLLHTGEKRYLLTGAHAGARSVAFDQRRTVLGRGIEPGVRELPVG